jgi:outer membrane protein assembly factor BamB
VRNRALRGTLALFALAIMGACGGPPPARSKVRHKVTTVATDPPPSTVTTLEEKEEEVEPSRATPFVATSGPGDVPVPFVRDERSSRLDAALPRGRAREIWRVPLGGPSREPCTGTCPALKGSFVLAAGNRVAVAGADGWVLFDTSGARIRAGKAGAAGVRLDRASGAIVPDETRVGASPDAKIAIRNGLVVEVRTDAVHVGERAIEGRFEAYDVAIDDGGLACVIVRQADALLLWTVPVAGSASIGRHRIANGPRRALGPPVLGKSLRVVVLDTGMLALGLDGNRVWERRGAPPTGGVSITSDDHVLVADKGKIIAIDPRGRASELWADNDVVFVTPPIIAAMGLLFVASDAYLHALSFS